MSKLWFKVLDGDRSCSGGRHTWSLPVGDTPGEWQAIDGDPLLCERGFHVTEKPPYWMDQGRQVYVAEIDGKVAGPDAGAEDDTKVAAQRCRLLRLATAAELAAVGIYTDGVHTLPPGSRRAHASGSAKVTASGSASVTASGSAKVTAYDSASVTAYGSAKVTGKVKSTTIVMTKGPTVALEDRAAEVNWASGWAEFRRASGPAEATA